MTALSPRQQLVVELMVRDETYKEICSRLGLSMGTVCQHISRAYRKLGVADRRSLRRVMKRTTRQKEALPPSLWAA